MPTRDAGDAGSPPAVYPTPNVRVEHVPADDALPDFGAVPFPSDLSIANGGITFPAGLERVIGLNPEVFLEGFAATSGFARQANAIFFVDGSIDPASLPDVATIDAGASIALVDVDPASPSRGTRTPVTARYLPSIGCITVAALPGAILPPGVRHAFVVTRRVRDDEGVALGPSPELERIAGLDAEGRDDPAEGLYGDALDALVEDGIVGVPEDVAGLAVFTTSTAWEELYTLRDRLRSGEVAAPQAVWDPADAAPYNVAIFGIGTTPSLDDWLGTAPRDENGLEWPGGDDPAGIAHDAIGAVASFAMPAPRFLDATTGHFEGDAQGIRIADPAALIPVTLVIPRSPPPASGYPVVVHGHGLSNDRGSMLSYANELARAGFAVIGIDDVLHGTRAGLPDVTSRFPGAYDGPDGIPDPLPFPAAFFGNFLDFVATRDHFRQTVLDQVSLVRLVQNPALDLSSMAAALGGATPSLDGSKLAWSGGSLGGIMGSMTVSVESEFRAAALQVPGGGFIPFVVTASAELNLVVETITLGSYEPVGEEPLDELHPVGLLLSHITEPGDPLAYVGALFGDRPPGVETDRRPDVLVTYTADDEVLPNLATHALIRAMGLPLVGPVLIEPEAIPRVDGPVSQNVNGRTAGAVQYAPSTHALGYNRRDVRKFEPSHPRLDVVRFPALPAWITVELPIREHSDQLTTFLQGTLDGTAEIRVTVPTRADFDADGLLDDAEIAAGTDPLDPASW